MLTTKSYREDRFLKKLRSILIIFMILTAVVLPVRAAAQPDYIRLHIAASSDSLIDQAVKLGVRNAVRRYTDRLLAGCASADEAWDMLQAHQADLLAAAEEACERLGFSAGVMLELGVFPFPDRVYADELVPSGDYRAVKITLGEGEGRNWWCVVYPSLCLPEDADTDRPLEFYSSVCRWAIRLWEAIRR